MPRDGFSIRTTGFKELSRSLDRLSRETQRRFAEPMRIPVQFELDDDRYLDRACPAPECRNAFKVRWEDYRNIVRDEAAYCVLCRHEAEAQEFHTPAQQEYLQGVALGYVTQQLAESFRAARLNFKPNSRSVPLSAEASEALTQRTTCTECGCRYASLGSAYFCHACGHNGVSETFVAAMATVRASVQLAIGADFGPDRDAAQDVRRFMIESGLNRAVNDFEAFASERYLQLAPHGPAAGPNAFQNLGRSNALWRPVIGRDYTDMLSTTEYSDLARLFQQRNLTHRGGKVDQKYLDRSGDTTYQVGQRVVVTPEAVQRLVSLVEKLAAELASSARI